jgi:hypothetical protein
VTDAVTEPAVQQAPSSHSVRQLPKRLLDAAAILATALLLAVLAGRAILAIASSAPLHASELLDSAAPADSGTLVLLLDGDSEPSPDVITRVRESSPGRALTIHRIPWPVEGRSSPSARLGALARAYGYSELPLALLVGEEGQVVRIHPIHPPR